MTIESVMLANHLILCHPILLLPLVFPSIRVFSSESALYIRWSKCWSFSISLSSEYSRLISFRIAWFELLVRVQGTLKSLLQHHSLKASILCQRTLAASSRTPSDSRALQATQVPHQTLMSMPSFPHCRAPSSALSSCAWLASSGQRKGPWQLQRESGWARGPCSHRVSHLVPFSPYSSVYCVTLGKFLGLPWWLRW